MIVRSGGLPKSVGLGANNSNKKMKIIFSD